MKTFAKWIEAIDELGMKGPVDQNYIQQGVADAQDQMQKAAQQQNAYNASPQGMLNTKIRLTIQKTATLSQQLNKFNNIRDGYAPKAKILQKYPQLMDLINQLDEIFSKINIDEEIK